MYVYVYTTTFLLSGLEVGNRNVPSMNLENVRPRVEIREAELHLAIETARTKQSWIECVRSEESTHTHTHTHTDTYICKPQTEQKSDAAHTYVQTPKQSTPSRSAEDACRATIDVTRCAHGKTLFYLCGTWKAYLFVAMSTLILPRASNPSS